MGAPKKTEEKVTIYAVESPMCGDGSPVLQSAEGVIKPGAKTWSSTTRVGVAFHYALRIPVGRIHRTPEAAIAAWRKQREEEREALVESIAEIDRELAQTPQSPQPEKKRRQR